MQRYLEFVFSLRGNFWLDLALFVAVIRAIILARRVIAWAVKTQEDEDGAET